MPEELDELPESRSGQEKYPWDEWLDGKPRIFVRGEDFECGVRGFRSVSQQAAERRGGSIRSRFVDGVDGDRIAFKFVEEES